MSWDDVRNESKSNEKENYTKFPEGTTMIRILDAEPYSFWQHWIQSTKTSVNCPGKDCPICNVIAKAKANNETPMYNNSRKHAMRVWNYTTNQMEIMTQGKGFMQQILDLHEEIGDIRTYDIKVKRSGGGLNTTYTTMPTAPSDFKFAEHIHDVNMEKLFSAPSNDIILQLMEGKTWSEIGGEEVA